jgi:hypothetical protein
MQISTFSLIRPASAAHGLVQIQAETANGKRFRSPVLSQARATELLAQFVERGTISPTKWTPALPRIGSRAARTPIPAPPMSPVMAGPRRRRLS